MKKVRQLMGFMILITSPFLVVIYIIGFSLLVPFVVVYCTFQQVVECCRDLFDLKNNYRFLKNILEKCYKLMVEG